KFLFARHRGVIGDASRIAEETQTLGDFGLPVCEPAKKEPLRFGGRAHGRPFTPSRAFCGDAARAEKLAETSRLFPNGTVWNDVELPGIRPATALQRNEPAKTVELLASTSSYERSYLTSIYLRALAYLRLHKGAEAAAEFRKIADRKGTNWALPESTP